VFKVVNSFATFIYIAFAKRSDVNVGYCKGSWEQLSRKVSDADAATANSWNTTFPPAATSFGDENMNGLLAIYNVRGVAGDHKDYRGDCFGELAYQLFIIFGTMILVNNAIEIMGPIIGKWLQNRAQTKVPKEAAALNDAEKKTKDVEAPSGPVNEKLVKITDTSRQSDAENEFEFPQYEGTFADYDELIIQFGFVVLFVVVFPAAPFLAFLNNIIEFRLDATKMLGFTRRPHPKGTYDMGTWFYILDLLSWVMVISNTGLIVFSSENFRDRLTDEERWITFVVVEHILIGIKLAIQFFVPDVPQDVDERIARQAVIRHTLVDPNY
jgi:hypothetical protein